MCIERADWCPTKSSSSAITRIALWRRLKTLRQEDFVERRSVEEAAAFIKGTVTPGEVILLKSARNLHLERILLSFELKVRCWEQACRKKEDCVQCGSYAIPFAGLER